MAREDGNMTGSAGVMFVYAELLKHRIEASITLRNATQIDLIAYNPRTVQTFTIQVKTLRDKNYFPIREIKAEHMYIFVILHEPGETTQYFIAPGKRLLSDPEKYAYLDPGPAGFHGIGWKQLTEFKDRWDFFERRPLKQRPVPLAQPPAPLTAGGA